MLDRSDKPIEGLSVERYSIFQHPKFATHTNIVLACWFIAGTIQVVRTGRFWSLPTLFLWFPGCVVAVLIATLGFAIYAKAVEAAHVLRSKRSPLWGLLLGVVLSVGIGWWVVATLVAPVWLAGAYVQLARDIIGKL